MATYKQFRAEKRRRKARNAAKRFFVTVLIILMLCAVVYLFMRVVVISREKGAASSLIASSELLPDESVLEEQVQSVPESLPYPMAENGLVLDYPKLATEETVLAPNAHMLALPESSQKVDLSYFADAAFVGDSLADGFRVYLRDQLPATTRYFTAKGLSPMSFFISSWDIDGDGVQTLPLDDITAAAPKKIYVELGINSMANNQDDETILKYYGQLVDELKTRCPGAIIYVQSITPVTAAKAAEQPQKFAITRIQGLNDLLAQMCIEKDVVYLDLHEVLTNSEGYLNTDLCWPKPDGFHMAPAGYDVWLEYLRTHAVHSSDNVYV